MMYYYEVVPFTSGFANQPLTYSSDQILQSGASVSIKIRNKSTQAVIYKRVQKPQFETKPIISVLDEPLVPHHLLSLSGWISSYYATPLSVALRSMLPRGLGKKRRPLNKQASQSKQRSHISMNEKQKSAVDEIENATGTVWLHGTTGSGKTRIYVELADRSVADGKDCLILVPEISLTPQLLEQFRTLSSSNNIHIVHSGLTESQRHTLWREANNSNTPMVIIGPRSALFMPLKNIGLIILDEAHDQSYHQDQQPRYSSLRVASYLANLTKAKLVLASATPPVDEIYFAKAKKLQIVRISEPIFSRTQDSHIVNLADRSSFTKNRWLSDSLLSSIENGIEHKKKSLLLLNLRGTRQNVFCSNCGWFAVCPNCEIPLKYHHDTHRYLCHICDHQEKAHVSCPVCKQPELQYRGVGTKQIEIDLKKIFSGLKIVRYDRDATSRMVSHDDIYQKIMDAKTQIIIGTQLVGKGLDIAGLTTIGVVNADTSLQIPDYSSAERTFQMIYQVAGRAGRQGESSSLFVQTYMPAHPVIKYAMEKDYESFYKHEITSRRASLLSPFVFMAKIIGEFSSLESAERKSHELARLLCKNNSLKVLGPAPAFHEYYRNKYRWQVIVKSKHRKEIVKAVESLPSSWSYYLDPDTLL